MAELELLRRNCRLCGKPLSLQDGGLMLRWSREAGEPLGVFEHVSCDDGSMGQTWIPLNRIVEVGEIDDNPARDTLNGWINHIDASKGLLTAGQVDWRAWLLAAHSLARALAS